MAEPLIGGAEQGANMLGKIVGSPLGKLAGRARGKEAAAEAAKKSGAGLSGRNPNP